MKPPSRPSRAASRSRTPADSPLPKRLFHALTRLVRTYQFRDRERVGYHGVTVTQVYALEIVARREPVTVGALAAELGLDKSTTSRVVEAMDSAGLVRRAADPDDGRAWALTLTPAGRRTYRRIETDLVREVARVLGEVRPAARSGVLRFIEAFADAAQQRTVLRNNPARIRAERPPRRVRAIRPEGS